LTKEKVLWKKENSAQQIFFVNLVGLGCMGFSHAYGTAVEKSEAIKTIRAAYDIGYDFFDTAECYLGTFADGTISNNEEIIDAFYFQIFPAKK